MYACTRCPGNMRTNLASRSSTREQVIFDDDNDDDDDDGLLFDHFFGSCSKFAIANNRLPRVKTVLKCL